MATALAEKINKDFLKCSICLEPFNNPRGLPCLHSFCEECLEKWAKAKKKGKAKEFACPNCMKLTRIPAEGIQGFPAHFLVNSLQETVNMEKIKDDYSTKPCSVCNKPDIHAVFYCYNCQHFLCQTCHDSHSVWEAMKHHKVVSTEDLTSGKASLSGPSEEADKYCAEHEGEQNKFYCKTCGKLVCRDCIIMKQRCRDHDYETLKEMSAEKSTELRELMQITEEHKKLCQKAIVKVDKANSELSKQVVEVKTNLDQVKKEYVKQVENVFTKEGGRVDQVFAEGKKKYDEIKSNLFEKLQQLDIVYQEGQTLLETASHSGIIFRFQSVQKKLDEACSGETYKEVGTLSDIPMPTMPTYVVGQCWKQCRELNVTSTGTSKIEHWPVGIVTTSENKIAIGYMDSVQVFSNSDKHEHYLDVSLCNGEDVAIDSKDRLVAVCHNPGSYAICIYDNKTFQLSEKYPLGSITRAVVAVDKNDSVILGLWKNSYNSNTNRISVYNMNKGCESSSFTVQFPPRSIIVSAPGEITVAYDDDTLQTSDYSGNTLHTFHCPPPVNYWRPRSVCVSSRYEVFVVNEGSPKAIYRYTAGGEYIRCVTSAIKDVAGIAMSHDDQELYVTEYTDRIVRVFKRP